MAHTELEENTFIGNLGVVAFKWLCFEEVFIYAFMCYLLPFFFQETDTLSRKKKCCTVKTQLATVYDCRTIN